MKEKLFAFWVAVSAIVTNNFGGWDGHLVTLTALMGIDYAFGILIPLFFGKSKRSKKGVVESRICTKGIIKKGMMLAIVFVCHRLDLAIGTDYLADSVIIALIINEFISLIEHARVIGIRIVFLEKILAMLREKLNERGR
jgi:toxin secretion/phage lysis holin